jgi:hypothetical protein
MKLIANYNIIYRQQAIEVGVPDIIGFSEPLQTSVAFCLEII